MQLGARFAKWGLGLFLFGVLLSFGIVAHYCLGARWPTGELFLQNITLWYACPWTLSVAAIQAGGLGMAALGLLQLAGARVSPRDFAAARSRWALPLCAAGLIGIFAVGYAGYFVFDAIWPSFYYTPDPTGKNAWLLAQAVCMALYFAGALLMFNAMRTALDAVREPA
jgi:hypothetical protein